MHAFTRLLDYQDGFYTGKNLGMFFPEQGKQILDDVKSTCGINEDNIYYQGLSSGFEAGLAKGKGLEAEKADRLAELNRITGKNRETKNKELER